MWSWLRLSLLSMWEADTYYLSRLDTTPIPWAEAPNLGLGKISNADFGGGLQQPTASTTQSYQQNTKGNVKYEVTAYFMVNALLCTW